MQSANSNAGRNPCEHSARTPYARWHRAWRIAACALIASFAGLAGPAHAAYPDKPVHMIVPYPPGGGIDPSARVLSNELAKQLGQSIVVDNVGGASGRIGTQQVARARPDGYNLLFASGAPNVTLPAAYGDKLAYDEKKDFMPIALVAEADYVLLVSKKLPITNLKELVDYAKANPDKLTYASSGLLSGPHLAGELLAKLAGVKLTHVPYRGNGPALAALMSGEVSMTFDSAGGVVARGPSEYYRVIAYSGDAPLNAFPDAPNLAKIYPGHNVGQWYGIMVPAGTPAPVVARLREAVAKSVNDETVKKQFADMGLVAVLDSTPASFTAYVDGEIKRWQEIFKTSGIPIPKL
jgi:tripartite-type tricarboxylate transporter receptor subunit TctC